MTDDGINVERVEEGIALVTLVRSERRNALTDRMFDRMIELQREFAADESLRAVIITGEGAGFCAGLDLGLAEQLPDRDTGRYLRDQERWSAAIVGWHSLSVPVIAAVNGVAAGAGLGLALAADIRFGDEDARFNAAFVRIGLSAGDVGVSWLLPRVIGLGRASEVLFTGRFIVAQEALSIGLVSEVVPVGSVVDRALECARTILGNSPFGMRTTKQVLVANAGAVDIEAAVAIENRTQTLATRTEDFREALAAFREKRAPKFTGR
jgi:enoyl-CoA hydratase